MGGAFPITSLENRLKCPPSAGHAGVSIIFNLPKEPNTMGRLEYRAGNLRNAMKD
jgi:hypothetical protein